MTADTKEPMPEVLYIIQWQHHGITGYSVSTVPVEGAVEYLINRRDDE